MFTIPDPVIKFFEESGLNPEKFDSFEELSDAVQRELENGIFVFPLGPNDLQTINNIINFYLSRCFYNYICIYV